MITALKSTLYNASGIFILASLFSNFLNFVFNAYLGRALSVENFGLVTFINTLVLLSGIFINAYGSSVTHRVAFLITQVNKSAGLTFVNSILKNTFNLSLFLMLLWLLLIPVSAKFFKIGDIASLLLFTPIIALFLNGAVFKGYLSGNLLFIQISIALIVESISKLLFAVILINSGQSSFVYVSIPLALGVSFLTLFLFSKKISKEVLVLNKKYAFPRRFFAATLIAGLSSSGFLTLDLLLVKHYLLPSAAGEYALLSLTGKMIFFLGSLFNGLILAFTSQEFGAKRPTKKMFSKLLVGTIALTLFSYFSIVFLGPKFLPIFFGAKIIPVLTYLPVYSLAIALFTISSSFIVFHLARHHFAFSFLAFVSSASMIIGIFLFHADINQITDVILKVSVFNFFAVVFFHLLNKNGKFILRNLIDLVDIFKPIPNQNKDKPQQILIFNWRDTKHQFAGGAEVYIHELARRWVKLGYNVTLFCGNDGQSIHNEVVDGVQVIRRGGFYFVYVWAFFYYIFKFRGKYDLIIDTQNGIPFFTPFYAKEQIFCLMFHVHQEVFSKSLPKSLAFVASILENRLMPWAYRRTKFITISESSKKEIEDLGLGKKGIEVIYPGIDLKTYKPSTIKSPSPLVIYIGRLQIYKSVDVLIRSAKSIIKKSPKVKIIIAGDGEERSKLEKLVQTLGLGKTIQFLGKVTEQEKIKLYQTAWIAVNPSLKEGWGITTIEANACGTPVVASNVPGLRDSVRNPSTGYLVEYGNPRAFAKRITELINNTDLRKHMEKKSVLWAKNFEWSKSAERGIKIINYG